MQPNWLGTQEDLFIPAPCWFLVRLSQRANLRLAETFFSSIDPEQTHTYNFNLLLKSYRQQQPRLLQPSPIHFTEKLVLLLPDQSLGHKKASRQELHARLVIRSFFSFRS